MKPIQLVVFVIWGALCLSLLMYAMMLNVMTFAPVQKAQPSLTSIFALVAGIAAAMSFVMRRVLLGGFASGRLEVDGFTARNQFVAGHMVVFALSEGVGVLGFVNGLMTQGRPDAWLPFIGGSLVLLLLHIPLPGRFPGSRGSQQREELRRRSA